MASKASTGHCLGGRLAVIKFNIAPATGRGIFACVLDHELHAVLGRRRDKRLRSAEGLLAFLQWVILPGQARDDSAVRVRKRSFPGGLDCNVVAQDGSQVVE